MFWFSAIVTPEVRVVLAALALATGTISLASLLVERTLRQRSRPLREIVLRFGLCLSLLWPVILLSGAVARSVAFDQRASTTQGEGTALPAPAAMRDERIAPADGESRAKAEATGVVWIPDPAVYPQSEEAPLTSAAIPSRRVVIGPQPAPSVATFSPMFVPRSVLEALLWVCTVWVVGSGVAVAILLRDLMRLRRMSRRLTSCDVAGMTEVLAQAMQATGLRRVPRLCVSQEVGSPCISGVWRPTLILPPSFAETLATDTSVLLGILTHECAHIVRRDIAWSLLARLAQAIYWWEPGLRRIARKLSHLREEICDNYALSSSVNAHQYAKALVDFAEGPVFRPLVGVLGMVGKNNSLSERVERLLQETPHGPTRLGRWSKWGVLLLALGVGSLIAVAGAYADAAGLFSILPVEPPQAMEQVTSTVNVDPIFREQSRSASGKSARNEVAAEKQTDDLMRPALPAADSAKSLFAVEDVPAFPLKSSNAELAQAKTEPPLSEPARSRTSLPNNRAPSNYPSFDSDPIESASPGPMVNFEQMRPPVAYETLPFDVRHPEQYKPGEPVVMVVKFPAESSFTFGAVRFRGFIVAPPAAVIESTPFGPFPTPPPDEAPKSEAAAETEVPEVEAKTIGPVRLQVPQSFLAVWTELQRHGAVATLVQGNEPPEDKAIVRLDLPTTPQLVRDHVQFLIAIEALANETGEYRGLRCWGRDLPETETGERIEALTKTLTEWKAACEQSCHRGSSNEREVLRSTKFNSFETMVAHSLSVELRVFDNMRYGDVRAIVKTCEDLQLGVNIVGDSATVSGEKDSAFVPRAIASVELTLVYDKKGQRVGNRALLMAHKARAKETQIITDDHWDRALGDFAGRYSKDRLCILLLKADPDVPTEMLESFFIRANKAGVNRVLLNSGAELMLESTDVLVPLIDETPARNQPFPYDPTSTGRGDEPFDGEDSSQVRLN